MQRSTTEQMPKAREQASRTRPSRRQRQPSSLLPPLLQATNVIAVSLPACPHLTPPARTQMGLFLGMSCLPVTRSARVSLRLTHPLPLPMRSGSGPWSWLGGGNVRLVGHHAAMTAASLHALKAVQSPFGRLWGGNRGELWRGGVRLDQETQRNIRSGGSPRPVPRLARVGLHPRPLRQSRTPSRTPSLESRLVLLSQRHYGEAVRAAATASSRELTPRARKRRRMWFLTVSVLRWSSAAICFVERPCSRRRSTST